jgi:hypothetical protein
MLALLSLSLLSCNNSECLCPGNGDGGEKVTMTYLFREAWGDCMNGCLKNRYWYFGCRAGACSLVGEWDSTVDLTVPEWWAEARIAKTYFETGGECPYSPWPECSDVARTPMGNEEAEEMAIWLSGSLVAPESLYLRVLADLEGIRATYGDSIPQLREIEFFSIWQTSNIAILITSEAMERFQAGEYDDLDSLNTRLRLSSMEQSFDNWLLLEFEGRLNSNRLVDIYVAEPSVVFGEPSGYAGDWPNVYPWVKVNLK